MADVAIQEGRMRSGTGNLSIRTALKLAWATWTVLLVLPFLLFLSVDLDPHVSRVLGCACRGPFLVPGFVGLSAGGRPASFFWRGRLFKMYWSGHPIPPGEISPWNAGHLVGA